MFIRVNSKCAHQARPPSPGHSRDGATSFLGRRCNVLGPALDNVLMPTSTVAELVNEARGGSAEARDELVRRHHREAAILAAAMVNDATEAEDLSQEAFIRAFRNLDLLVDPSRFAAWLRRSEAMVTGRAYAE